MSIELLPALMLRLRRRGGSMWSFLVGLRLAALRSLLRRGSSSAPSLLLRGRLRGGLRGGGGKRAKSGRGIICGGIGPTGGWIRCLLASGSSSSRSLSSFGGPFEAGSGDTAASAARPAAESSLILFLMRLFVVQSSRFGMFSAMLKSWSISVVRSMAPLRFKLATGPVPCMHRSSM